MRKDSIVYSHLTNRRASIEPHELIHGAIYLVQNESYPNKTTETEARCNVSVDGDEIWFTSKKGEILSGTAIEYLRDNDPSFINHDVY